MFTIHLEDVVHFLGTIIKGGRREKNAEEYASIMSYISTARKQGMAYFESVKQALSGNALALLEQWV